jgi:hypothetical protein
MRDEDGRLVDRPEMDTLWQGRRVRAGNRPDFRLPNETKHEFYVYVLLQTLRDRRASPPVVPARLILHKVLAIPAKTRGALARGRRERARRMRPPYHSAS